MAGIKDIAPTQAQGSGQSGVGNVAGAQVMHGAMTNGIPNIDVEPLPDIDQAIQFAASIVGTVDILYIEYQGLKLGVNV